MAGAESLPATGEGGALGRSRAGDTWTPAFIAYLGYIFIIVTYKFGIGSVMMAVALATLLLQPERIRTPRFLWWFVAWIFWASIGYLTTPFPEFVRESLIEHIKVLLVGLVAVNALRTTTQVRYFMLFMVFSFLLFPVRATLISYARGETVMGRAVGPFIYDNPNDLAAVSILMLAPALALWASEARRSPVRWLGFACAIPLVITIFLTQSRGAFLALVTIAIPSGIALARRRLRLVVAFAAVIAVAVVKAPAGLWERLGGLRKATSLETIGQMDQEGSARERLALLQTAVRIIEDRPLLGIGLGAYGPANARYNPAVGDRDTHNTYLNITAETGLPGLVLFLGLVTSVLRGARDARRRARGAFLPEAEVLRWLQYGMIGYLVAAVFGSFSRLTFPYVFLGLLWSAAQVARARRPAAPSPLAAPGHGAHTPIAVPQHRP